MTYDNYYNQGYNAFINALGENNQKLTFDNLEDLESTLRERTEPFYIRSELDVIYAHEAWEVVGSPEFDCENLDFSGCKTALDCLVLEAQEKISNALTAGFNEALEDTAKTIKNLFNLAQRETTEEVNTISITNGDVYGWFPHSLETKEGVCIYERGDIDMTMWTAEISLNDLFSISVKLEFEEWE